MSLPDLRALLATFSDAGVEHVVIGGIALGLHGGIRTTEDLDIVPNPEPANLERLFGVLTMRRSPAGPSVTTWTGSSCWPRPPTSSSR